MGHPGNSHLEAFETQTPSPLEGEGRGEGDARGQDPKSPLPLPPLLRLTPFDWLRVVSMSNHRMVSLPNHLKGRGA